MADKEDGGIRLGESPLTKDKIAAAIQKAPAVAGVLKKLAGKVARGVSLPGSFTAKGLDYDAQRATPAEWFVPHSTA